MTHATHPAAIPSRQVPTRQPGAAPAVIRLPGPLFAAALRLGLPAGPNRLVTIRGRKSGVPRTLPIAVAVIEGRRYLIGAYGDVQWVRNLRAAGEATVRDRGREVPYAAHELDREQAVDFFGRIIPAYIGRFPRIGRAFGRALFGLVGPEILNDPAKAAQTRPVFELTPAA